MLRRRLPRTVLIAAAAIVAVVIILVVRDGGPVGPLASCFDFAEEQTGAAQSPPCAPFILPDGEAERFLDTVALERLELGFYLVADEASWAAISKPELWRMISAAVSAIQAVHGEDADVNFIVTPASREESALLLKGDYPEERLVATAIHSKRTTKRLAAEDVPNGHFVRAYRLSVR